MAQVNARDSGAPKIHRRLSFYLGLLIVFRKASNPHPTENAQKRPTPVIKQKSGGDLVRHCTPNCIQ